jgi:hypothetical protein
VPLYAEQLVIAALMLLVAHPVKTMRQNQITSVADILISINYDFFTTYRIQHEISASADMEPLAMDAHTIAYSRPLVKTVQLSL